jgi:hypothetical protein
VFSPASYRPHGLDDPALPLAPCLGCAVFRAQATPTTVKQPTSSSHRASAAVKTSRLCLADPPQRVSTSHRLCVPSALEDSQVHCSRALPARCVPPSGFGYPLGVFLPANPCRFCFTPAALMGLTLRSVLLPRGTSGVSAEEGLRAVSIVGSSVTRGDSRPDEPRLPGFSPRGSPLRPERD